MQTSKKINSSATLAFCLYMLCLFWIVILKCNLRQGVLDSREFMSQMTLAERIFFSAGRFAGSEKNDILINISIFIPFGLLVPFLNKSQTYIKSALAGIGLTLLVEISQLLIPIGGFTYIDIINNSIGTFIGIIIHYHLKDLIKEKPLITIINSSSALQIGILIFAAINTVNNIDIYL